MSEIKDLYSRIELIDKEINSISREMGSLSYYDRAEAQKLLNEIKKCNDDMVSLVNTCIINTSLKSKKVS